MPLARKLFFGFIAVVVIPLLFFLLLEGGLKVLGFGNSFDYFNRIEIDGRKYLQDNPTFIEQFYPASLDIIPLENTFSEEPTEEVLRILVLGGSAARGFPNPEHGFGRQLEAMLKQALPSRRVEVINTAMTAINSHVVYETARSLPAGSADFAIVLMGNNEVIGPYGPGTFSQSFLSQLGLIRFLQTFKRSSIGQAMTAGAASMTPRDHKEELKWQGMQMFTDENVPQSDPRLDAVYAHYEANLRDIIRALQHKGAHVIVSTVPVNLRDSAPFASAHSPSISDGQRQQFERSVERGDASAASGSWEQAISDYEAAVTIDPTHADAQYKLAVAYQQQGDFQSAASHFDSARDQDTLRFRADSRINQIVRNVASDFEDGTELSFVDSEATFNGEGQSSRPGWNFFLEHVHFNFSGDYLLARNFYHSVLSNLGLDSHAPAAEAELARIIGYPSNMTVKVMDRVVSMVQSPPFTGQTNQADLEKLITSRRSEIESQLGTVNEQIERREKVLQSGVEDWRLRYELAYLYEHVRDRQSTYKQLFKLYSEYPHHRDSLVMLAKMLHQDKEYRREIPYLERALNYTRGDESTIAQLSGWLGLAHFNLGESDVATEYLLEVVESYPDQIHYAIQAYATLIRYSKKSGDVASVQEYATDAQRYAERLVSAGKDRAYPPLYVKMSQIMRLAGNEAEAGKWKEMQRSNALKTRDAKG